MTAETTGQRIRRIRTAAGLSQASLAGVGVSAKYVGRIERGEVAATLDQLAVIAAPLDTTAEYLSAGEAREEVAAAVLEAARLVVAADAPDERVTTAAADLGLDPDVASAVELRLAAALRGTRFSSVEEFYSDDERRRLSTEVDYGVQWVAERTSWPRYRVSWIEATGEVYAVRLGRPDSVEVIGWAATRDAADAALEGWENLPVRDSVVGWARDRFAGDPFPLDPGDDPEAET